MLMAWWGQGQTCEQINVMQWAGGEPQAVGASIMLPPRPDPRPPRHGYADPPLGAGSRPDSVLWPPSWATPQPRRPGLSGGMAITGGLGELSETWQPGHGLGPLPVLMPERPVHRKPERSPGAATPCSFARPVLSPQLAPKAAAGAG